VAGHAGDRPEGVATGHAGHGDGRAFVLRDRAGDLTVPLSSTGRAFHDRLVAAIDDDLDMPTAIALVREIVRSKLSDDERRWLVLDADLVLGLDLHRAWEAPAWETPPMAVNALMTERDAARAAHDFARSDAIRDALARLGWEVVDGPAGSSLRRRG
jgi:cysteinyl-tRNA synthetase